jgi:hypothetical protein
VGLNTNYIPYLLNLCWVDVGVTVSHMTHSSLRERGGSVGGENDVRWARLGEIICRYDRIELTCEI